MPGPSPWPFFLPIAATVMLFGVIFSSVLIIGGLILAATTIAWIDVTGILAAGLISAAGLFVLPAKRRQLKKEFHTKIVDMREQLVQTMQQEIDSLMPTPDRRR